MRSAPLLLVLLLLSFPLWGRETGVTVSFDDLVREPDRYVGRRVMVTTPLVINGVYYDSLILSDQRLYVPEEHAIGLSEGDSAEYWRLVALNRTRRLCLQTNHKPYKVYTGSIVRNLTAMVTRPGVLVTGKAPRFDANRPDDCLPRMQNANLVICSSNVQNLFADLGGYAGAKTEKQLDLQVEKIAKGLLYTRADLFALCEVEEGNKTPALLVERMNAKTRAGRYSWVESRTTDGDTIGVCYVYRTDRLLPYGETGYGYPEESVYGERFKIKGFEHRATGERFVVSLNHLRSKRGPAQRADSLRMLNMHVVDSLLQLAPALYRDSDILILGDFNCYTLERPIRHLIRQGYADQVMRYDSTGYSYVYRSEAGFLDRVFASPSMADKIIGVKALHLNADCFYSLGYRSRYAKRDRYRFSDHDPVLIYLRLSRSAAAR